MGHYRQGWYSQRAVAVSHLMTSPRRARRFTLVSLDERLVADVWLGYGRALRDDCVLLHIRDSCIVEAESRTSLETRVFAPSVSSDIYDCSVDRHKRLWSFVESTWRQLSVPECTGDFETSD